MSKNYDFAGYVTKNDILCSDGVAIKQNAFANSNGKKVPLVWNHNYDRPSNVLGYVALKQTDLGTYGYGYFNDSEDAMHAKAMVKHGDISSMSIGARKVKRQGTNIVHGEIYEVSLVLAGANPGALIDSVMTHGDGQDEESIMYTGQLIHSSDDVIEEKEDKVDENNAQKSYSLDDVMKMSDEEIDEFVSGLSDDDAAALADDLGISADDIEDEDEEDNESMKHNIFNGMEETQGEVFTHADQEVLLQSAISDKTESFRDYLLQAAYDEATQKPGVDYGITNIETLFPEVHNLDRIPKMVMDKNTCYKDIINGVSKSPFSKIRTRYFDIDVDDEKQRAKGYVKGTRKVDEVIKVLKRESYPTTIYKKQKLDRDDIIEITDFDVVSALQGEMRVLLEMELGRCILVGDGRESSSPYKIDEEKIRPIATDDEVYSIKAEYKDAENFFEAVIKAMPEYEGSGKPTMYIDPQVLADVKLLKGTDGRWLSGHIPSNQEIATLLGMSDIKETTFLKGTGKVIVVNLSDYTVGSTKGGQVTSFSDFDIDFNKYKYLIETRLSGALTIPKSAIVFSKAGASSDPESQPAG